MHQTEGVTILATQLAGGDRRALSQAWYSALHLAETPLARMPLGRPPIAAVRPARSPQAAPLDAPRGYAAPNASDRTRPALRQPERSSSGEERRSVRSRFDRSLARAVERRVLRGGAASFALSAGGGRVQILVRVDDARTRIVALCAPSLRERVERALAHVRFAVTADRWAGADRR